MPAVRPRVSPHAEVLAGRYRIIAELGSGATGSVYRAFDLHAGSEVAVKVLHERHHSESMIAQRFRREAKAAALLAHPNCVHVMDSGTTSVGADFLVMPLVQGVELRALMTGPLPLADAVDLIRQVLTGLEHAHGLGLVHRDVKPENVLVVAGVDGRRIAKIVDFGLVKLLERRMDGPSLTKTGLIFGTPYYMSPEQASGTTVDARADLYAVGAMLYEMLSGRPPFDAPTPIGVIQKHVFEDVPPLPASVPVAIQRFVMRLLAKAPQDRYESANAAQRAFEAALNEASSASAPVVVNSSPRLESFVGSSTPEWDWSRASLHTPPETLLRRSPRARLPFGWLAAATSMMGALVGAMLLGPAASTSPAASVAQPAVAMQVVEDDTAEVSPAAHATSAAQARDSAGEPDVPAPVAPRVSERSKTPAPAPSTQPRTKAKPRAPKRHRGALPPKLSRPSNSASAATTTTTTTRPVPPPPPPDADNASKLPGVSDDGGAAIITRNGKRVLRPS